MPACLQLQLQSYPIAFQTLLLPSKLPAQHDRLQNNNSAAGTVLATH